MGKRIDLIALWLLFPIVSLGQLKGLDMPESKLVMVKYGPFIGLEQGSYMNVHFGLERHVKQLKLIKPNTWAINTQFDYNFKRSMAGMQTGFWFKTSRADLTYGLRMVWQTDFDNHRFGVSPNIGYKILQAHFQLGCNLLSRNDQMAKWNTFYASLRWVFVNNRDIKKKGD
jgi:hypothetical protein